MKRTTALLLAAILCLCLAACGRAPEPEQSPQEIHTEEASTAGSEQVQQGSSSAIDQENAVETMENPIQQSIELVGPWHLDREKNDLAAFADSLDLFPGYGEWGASMDALSHQGTSCQLGTKLRTDETIGESVGESARQVQRYIRLTELIPQILSMVDAGKIALTPAVELSYLTGQEQHDLLETMESEDCTPSLSQAVQMKKLSQSGELNMDRIFEILREPRPIRRKRLASVWRICGNSSPKPTVSPGFRSGF